MAYRADIEIGVKGASRLKELQDRLTKLSRAVEDVNVQTIVDDKAVQSVNEYTKALSKATKTLNETAIQLDKNGNAIGNYKDNIRAYVTSLGQANQAQKITSDLIQQEIDAREKATAALKEYNAAAAPARQVGSMAGAYLRPGEAGLRGQSSRVDPDTAVAAAKDLQQVHAALAKQEQRSVTLLEEKLGVNRRITNELALQQQSQQRLRKGTGLSLPLPERTGVKAQVQELLALREKLFQIDSARTLELQKANSFTAQGVTSLKANLAIAQQLDGVYDQIVNSLKRANDRQSQLFRARANRAQRGDLSSENERRQQALNNLVNRTNRSYEIQNKINQAGLAIRKNDFNQAKQLGEQIDLLIKKEQRSAEIVRRKVAFRRQSAKAAQAEAKAARDEASRRRQDALGSALIGGAFPLLFGQGGGAALGGFIGGGAGGALGGQMGFALSLVGTQIGTFVDQIIAGGAELGQALNILTADIEALGAAAGFAGTETAAALQTIEELGTQQQALEAATALLAATVGDQGVQALKDFGADTTNLGNEFARAMSLMQTAAARFFGGIPGFVANVLKQANDLSAGLALDSPEAAALQKRRNELLGVKEGVPFGAQTGGAAAVSSLSKEELTEFLAIEEKLRKLAQDRRTEAQTLVQTQAQQLKDAKFLADFGIKDVELTKVNNKLKAVERDYTNENYVNLLKQKALEEKRIANAEAFAAAEKDANGQIKNYGLLAKVTNQNEINYNNTLLNIEQKRIKAVDQRSTKESKAAQRVLDGQKRILEASQRNLEVQQNRFKALGAETDSQRALLAFVSRKAEIERKAAADIKKAQEEGGPNAAQAVANIRAAEGVAIAGERLRLEERIGRVIEDINRPLDQIIEKNKDQIAFNAEYQELLATGVKPELAKQLAQIEVIFDKSLDKLNAEISSIEALRLQNDLTDEQIKKLDRLIEQRGILEGKRDEAKSTATDVENSKPGKIQSYMEELQRELQDTEGMIVSLAQTIEGEIGSAMSTAITNVITGTGTVQEAMSTMFANIGKAFIDMATQMIAKALIMKALGILGGAFGGGGSFSMSSGATGNFTQVDAGVLGSLGYADGGAVKPNGTYLVGERGPELLSLGNQPGYVHRNTSEVMDRYRGSGSEGGAASNVSVNYNVTEINEMRFVTEEQFRAGMTQAARDGARRGEASTFRTLRNSRSNRARVGL